MLGRTVARLLPLGWVALVSAWAHDGPHASVHDTVAGIVDRLGKTLPTDTLKKLDAGKVLSHLTPAERGILSSNHLRFEVRVPVAVAVLTDERRTNEPFWLAERGFRRATNLWNAGAVKFETWEREFPAGEIGLGVNSVGGGTEHYLVALRPLESGAALGLTNLFPATLRVGVLTNGVRAYADRNETVTNVPPAVAGWTLIRTLRERRDDGRLIGLLRWTGHPSSARPDHVVLTWSGDPRTSQAIQWRTRAGGGPGAVRWGRATGSVEGPPAAMKLAASRREDLEDRRLLNDPRVTRHTVELAGLEPGATYAYSVGDGTPDGWGPWRHFSTAQAGEAPFSFIYMGDAQNGLDRWGNLVQSAYRSRPDAAFYLMAGDLVNRGAERDDWDDFFENASGVFDRRPVVPVIGNHEVQGGRPTLYLKQFALPRNGPGEIEPERAYAFEYGGAQFVVLDSNLEARKQSAWLDRQLGRSRARWRFVTCHHPSYSSAAGRDNESVRTVWGPIFDRHRVDLVLQGHDHAYLRTYPMKANQRATRPGEGTVYVVAVSGTKFYPQATHDYTQVGFTNVATYQVLDIRVEGPRLTYRAFDGAGLVRDEFVLEKP